VDPFERLAAALAARSVRYVLIGVGGANYYAQAASLLFATRDRDLLLPLDPDNCLKAWVACESVGLSLWCGDDPLDQPRDRFLARRIVDTRSMVRASDGRGLEVDLTLIMAGFEFEPVWERRGLFVAQGVELSVARLEDIIESKARAGRPKDRLFLATHEAALRELLGGRRTDRDRS
jgi:hypothetical protein